MVEDNVNFAMACNDSPAAKGASSEARGAALPHTNEWRSDVEDGNCTNTLPGKLLRSSQVAA